MKSNVLKSTVFVAMFLVAIPVFAQNGMGGGGGNACSPTGTWFGSNGLGQNYLFTVTRIGGGRFMAVAEGLTDPAFCNESTAFRGEMARTGPNTYELRQILICDAYGTLTLWAAMGEIEFTGCDTFDALFDNIGAYLWGTGKIPFVDEYDFPFIPPAEPMTASYTRMPPP